MEHETSQASLLVQAAQSGSLQGVRSALEAASSGMEKAEALAIASEAGDERVVPVLLGAGADPMRACRGWSSAFEAAAAAGHTGVLAQLLQVHPTAPLGAAVIRAAANGHRGVLGYLLALGAPAPTEALANALLGGEWACVEALLVAGADLADSRRMAESLADSWPATARSRRAQIAFHVRRWEHSVAQRQAFLAL